MGRSTHKRPRSTRGKAPPFLGSAPLGLEPAGRAGELELAVLMIASCHCRVGALAAQLHVYELFSGRPCGSHRCYEARGVVDTVGGGRDFDGVVIAALGLVVAYGSRYHPSLNVWCG